MAGTYSSVVTLNNAGNSFTGSGAGLTSLNANNLASGTVPDARLATSVARTNQVWQLAENLGTRDNQALELKVNNTRALRLEPNAAGAPNVIGGAPVNYVSNSIVGATIAGGGATDYLSVAYTNRVIADFGTVGGGVNNMVSGVAAVVGGGAFNTVGAYAATVGGGQLNNSGGSYATIGGGERNLSGGLYTTIGGGSSNTNLDDAATIGGGVFNRSSAESTTIGGGHRNFISANFATIGGGSYNTSSNLYTTVGGGLLNASLAEYATVAGGGGNSSSGEGATVGGGGQNIAAGFSATVPGGLNNRADGNFSFAAGSGARANHAGSFAWADSAGEFFNTTANNQFLIRAGGGVGIGATNLTGALFIRHPQEIPANGLAAADNGLALGQFRTNSYKWMQSYGGALVLNPLGNNVGVGLTNPASALHVNGTVTATSFNPPSDRNLKENFTGVSPREVLEKVSALRITRWNFKGDEATPHLGPMAQDFHAAFQLGTDDRHIATVDADGVALAAIQGLNQKVESEKQKAEIERQTLRAENEDLKARLEKLERLLDEKSGGAR